MTEVLHQVLNTYLFLIYLISNSEEAFNKHIKMTEKHGGVQVCLIAKVKPPNFELVLVFLYSYLEFLYCIFRIHSNMTYYTTWAMLGQIGNFKAINF